MKTETLDDARLVISDLTETCQELTRERDRLLALLNTPEIADFMRGVPLEAAHQVEKWGPEHDAEKSGHQWMFLFGFLAGKAVQAVKSGNPEKAKHHAITAGAAAANFHRLVSQGHQPQD